MWEEGKKERAIPTHILQWIIPCQGHIKTQTYNVSQQITVGITPHVNQC